MSIVEGNSGTANAVFTVTLDGTPSGTVSVDFAAFGNDATAEVDFASTSGTLTFGPGVTSQTITVPILGDALDEYDELFNVTLSERRKRGTAGRQRRGDDPRRRCRAKHLDRRSLKAEGDRGEKAFYFTATLSAPSAKWVSFQYTTADGTASVAGSDYYAYGGTLYFAPGETTHAFVETYVRGDRTKESNETFLVNILSAQEATIADGQAVGTIVNDDGAALVQHLRSASAMPQIVEGNSGTRQLIFTMSLSQASSKEVRVNYATANDTAKTGDNDYESKSGTLRFAPGETTKTISITVNGDKKFEQDETVQASSCRAPSMARFPTRKAWERS